MLFYFVKKFHSSDIYSNIFLNIYIYIFIYMMLGQKEKPYIKVERSAHPWVYDPSVR